MLWAGIVKVKLVSYLQPRTPSFFSLSWNGGLTKRDISVKPDFSLCFLLSTRVSILPLMYDESGLVVASAVACLFVVFLLPSILGDVEEMITRSTRVHAAKLLRKTHEFFVIFQFLFSQRVTE